MISMICRLWGDCIIASMFQHRIKKKRVKNIWEMSKGQGYSYSHNSQVLYRESWKIKVLWWEAYWEILKRVNIDYLGCSLGEKNKLGKNCSTNKKENYDRSHPKTVAKEKGSINKKDFHMGKIV